MLNGQGAVGAGVYPALAGNGNLQSAEYVVHVVLHGKNGMPGFRDLLSEEQLASISNYVRSNLGNSHGAEITADFVQSFSNRK